MIKSNWDIFKAKFSGNTQSTFEWFCYLLFCKEFNRPYGISRYKNQSALETNPIEINEEVIGWQSKFYDTALSEHKEELLSTLEKAKRDYPNITKLLLFTNQEWGQSKGKEPQGLTDINTKAKDLGITLEWRTASFFESEFVSITNETLAKHFFLLEKSIFDFVLDQQKHTENILYSIHTGIPFKNSIIEIDRSKDITQIEGEKRQALILSGVGGVGKTALIKKLYENSKDKNPFYVFKATEFELSNLNELFRTSSFYDFLNIHKDIEEKTIVIDSAEKLLDLKNSEPFKEFLLSLIQEKWKIIFTTRNNYLDDLNYEFFQIYNIKPLNIQIKILELNELEGLSEKYSFTLPSDTKFLELLRNSFYLSEYLKFHTEADTLNYSEFKGILWNKTIRRNKPAREICFLKIASERADSGQFYITPNCESTLLTELLEDGILGYENAGYFITHDIYEEWSLEKSITNEFIKKINEQDFFNKIGQSLPIRRSFRNWLSENLLLETKEIKQFIEKSIVNNEIESFWKDEIIVSVLLSEYSTTFFNFFKTELLSNQQELLKKITFLLRLACKELDDEFFQQLGFKTFDILSLKYVLTKPRGRGWQSLIKFVFDNLEAIGIKNINFILPVIHDWTTKIKEGETTRISGLIALKFYQWAIENDVYFSRDDTKEKLIQTILYSASEIHNELKNIFDDILQNNWRSHSNPYYDLVDVILTKLDGMAVIKALPEYIYKLADLFWTSHSEEDDSSYYGHSSLGVENYFGLEEHHLNYHPASAYQTPIYWLFQSNLKGTVDFILEFTNKAIEKYAHSNFDKTIISVDIYLDEQNIQKQYISHCLWNMYRGTSAPSPELLQSMHMALEKYFLEIGKYAKADVLESWLLYLLRNTISASISSVIASIVLAYPEKTFNIAKILFKTQEFIMHDTIRMAQESEATSLYSMAQNMGITTNKFCDNERIKTCEDKHRQSNLEGLFLKYQCFRSEEISEDEANNRQKILWEILDNYYKHLPQESKQSDRDKTWRLYLARMDRRHMNITTEKTQDGLVIQFNPQIDSSLEKYREDSLLESSQFIKHISLKLWAEYKFKGDDRYKQYDIYELNPKKALEEAKEISEKLNMIEKPDPLDVDSFGQNGFYFFNHSIPAYVCAVLLRDYVNDLVAEENFFCKEVLFSVVSSSFHPNYRYQVSDGVEQAILSLPILLKLFPEDHIDIKNFLLFGLLKENHVSFIIAIRQLWENNFNIAQSLLLGYVLLKPRYDKLFLKIRKRNYKRKIYNFSTNEVLTKFIKENEEDLEKIFECKLTLSDITNLDRLDLNMIKIVLKVLPKKINNEDHKKIAKIIIPSIIKQLLLNNRDEKIDYRIRHSFVNNYVHFVLNAPENEIMDYLKPFIDHFKPSEVISDLFKEFIRIEDDLNTYDNFWYVWKVFQEKVFFMCKDGDGYSYIDIVVESYLFAQLQWKDTAKDWRSFKETDKKFFDEISKTIGHCPSVLYSISKLLNTIGQVYLDDGIYWVSNILNINKDYYQTKKANSNTIFYIENLTKKYIYQNREKVKKTPAIKSMLLVILNFLTEKGSVTGYMLRESII